MAERLEWGDIYLDKCMENKDLRKEIRVLQEILRSYLPVIGNSEITGNNKQK